MLYRQYKYKFYLNMNHSVEMQGRQGEIHSHTWEIAMIVSMSQNEFVRFSDIEEVADGILEAYQDKYLNETAPFTTMNPTLENVCDYLFYQVSKAMQERGWILLAMEMSETPSRVYQVSNMDMRDDFVFIE